MCKMQTIIGLHLGYTCQEDAFNPIPNSIDIEVDSNLEIQSWSEGESPNGTA